MGTLLADLKGLETSDDPGSVFILSLPNVGLRDRFRGGVLQVGLGDWTCSWWAEHM